MQQFIILFLITKACGDDFVSSTSMLGLDRKRKRGTHFGKFWNYYFKLI